MKCASPIITVYPSQQNDISTILWWFTWKIVCLKNITPWCIYYIGIYIIIQKFHVYLKTVWLLNQNKNALMVKILTRVNSDLTSYLNLQLP